MSAKFSTALVVLVAVFAVPIAILKAAKKREAYCGDKLKHCFWCGEDCHYYHIDKT